ncbi:hypothetical protein AVEN_117979-1 [Araneus ventricosus]|uniref:Uncharacterized protein n=1 Tax=Araneus ventricosus TaxID=182803 RepID=A0A4Y2WRU1_ARAVE|nr:hypothetical protein AVEN_117979-1 [Araneus ventricosus]
MLFRSSQVSFTEALKDRGFQFLDRRCTRVNGRKVKVSGNSDYWLSTHVAGKYVLFLIENCSREFDSHVYFKCNIGPTSWWKSIPEKLSRLVESMPFRSLVSSGSLPRDQVFTSGSATALQGITFLKIVQSRNSDLMLRLSMWTQRMLTGTFQKYMAHKAGTLFPAPRAGFKPGRIKDFISRSERTRTRQAYWGIGKRPCV